MARTVAEKMSRTLGQSVDDVLSRGTAHILPPLGDLVVAELTAEGIPGDRTVHVRGPEGVRNSRSRRHYHLLGLQTYFTAGEKEVRAWTVRHGSTAAQAAGVIHTDFEKGFIRAEVITYSDYIACKGEQGAKEAGKMRVEGRDYVVKDGDVLNFLFNV